MKRLLDKINRESTALASGLSRSENDSKLGTTPLSTEKMIK